MVILWLDKQFQKNVLPSATTKETIMSRNFGVFLTLLGLAAGVRAEENPERHLPATTQLYMRWDGMEAHRGASAKTALGKILEGNTVKLLRGLLADFKGNLPSLMSGASLPPKVKKELQESAASFLPVAETLASHGIVLGIEVRSIEAPDVQLMVVCPGAGKNAKDFLKVFKLAAALNETEVTELKIKDRTVHEWTAGPVHFNIWNEREDAIFTIGLKGADEVIERLSGKENLTNNVLFKKVRDFKEFETSARGFIDLAALVKLIQKAKPEATQFIEVLGLNELKHLTYFSGFEGPAGRSLIEVQGIASGKGLAKLLRGKTFGIADLPPMPADVLSFSATRFDCSDLYDLALEVAGAAMRLSNPINAPEVKDIVKAANQAVGLDIRNDLLGSLGDLAVVYTSPSESPLFRMVFLIRVRDSKKLQQFLDQVIQKIATLVPIGLRTKRKNYLGVELCQTIVTQGKDTPPICFAPTYAIHKDWLILALYPQPVQGYLLRASDQLPTWKPGPTAQRSLAALPKQFTGVSFSDPRPTLSSGLSFTPLVAAAFQSAYPDSWFDASLVPSAYEITQHLFPNIAVTTEQENSIFWHSLYSVPLPVDLNNMDTATVITCLVAITALGKPAEKRFKPVGEIPPPMNQARNNVDPLDFDKEPRRLALNGSFLLYWEDYLLDVSGTQGRVSRPFAHSVSKMVGVLDATAR
jgi:hypothetical protein